MKYEEEKAKVEKVFERDLSDREFAEVLLQQKLHMESDIDYTTRSLGSEINGIPLSDLFKSLADLVDRVEYLKEIYPNKNPV